MAVKGTNDKQAKHWLITLNNPTQEEYGFWHHLHDDKEVEYFWWQCEVGEGGTFHLQGALGYRRQMRPKRLHKLRGLQRAHFVHAHDPAGARAYCTKDETRATATQLAAHFGAPVAVERGVGDGTGPFRYGDVSVRRPGRRSDIREFAEKVRAGASDDDLLECAPGELLKYSGHVEKLRAIVARKRASKPREVTVEVLVGPTGSGKSHAAYVENPGAYRLMRPTKGGTVWFSGYNGEETIVLDDFRGSWMSYDHLLRILDKWPLTEQTKGGVTHALWTKVVITSTHPPGTWYEAVEFAGGELARRITKTRTFPEVVLPVAPLPTVTVPIPPEPEVTTGM